MHLLYDSVREDSYIWISQNHFENQLYDSHRTSGPEGGGVDIDL